jgi:hypothetical protein
MIKQHRLGCHLLYTGPEMMAFQKAGKEKEDRPMIMAARGTAKLIGLKEDSLLCRLQSYG